MISSLSQGPRMHDLISLTTLLVTFWEDARSAISVQTVAGSSTWSVSITLQFYHPKIHLITRFSNDGHTRSLSVHGGAFGCSEAPTLAALMAQATACKEPALRPFHALTARNVSTSLHWWLEPISGWLLSNALTASGKQTLETRTMASNL